MGMRKLLVLAALLSLAFPLVTEAVIGVPFAGRVATVVPCTCSAGAIVTFATLFAVGSVPAVGLSLYYQLPISITFSHFIVGIPGTFELGTYTPGVQAICLVGAPPLCS